MIGPYFYGVDANGDPLAFGKLYTYQAGTTTDKATYTTETGDVENTNPIILNGSGYAAVHLNGSYAMLLHDAEDNEIWSADPVSANTNTEWIDCLAATYISSTSFSVLGDQTNLYDVGRRVQIENAVDTFAYSNIVSSSFGGGITTITVLDAVVLPGIISICRSIISKGTLSSLNNTTYQVANIVERDDLTPSNGDIAVVADDGDGKGATYKYNGTSWVKISEQLTDAEIKAQYENNSDTNVFNDADEAKLDSGAGYMPLTVIPKTASYIVESGDIGSRIVMDSASATTITLNLSLMPDTTKQMSFQNNGDGTLTIEVSNLGTMTFNNLVTSLELKKGNPILTINGDSSTNANATTGSAIAEVVDRGSNANGYYTVWSDGLIEQWVVTSLQGNGVLLSPFPIPFTISVDLAIVGTNRDSGVSGGNMIAMWSPANTTLTDLATYGDDSSTGSPQVQTSSYIRGY